MSQNLSPDDGMEITVTQHLQRWNAGDPGGMDEVVTELFPIMHRMASCLLTSERNGHTLQPTALINELYLRLRTSAPPQWTSRSHFLAVVSTTMRRLLIDHARSRLAQRRGGKDTHIPIDSIEIGTSYCYDDLVILDELLTELKKADVRAARVTELRFFAGLTEQEIAQELKISEITVKRDWRFARAWLASHLASRK